MLTLTRTIMKTGLLLVAWAAPMSSQQTGSFTLTATVNGPTTVNLTWTAVAGANGYRVQRAHGAAGFAPITPGRITATAYIDTAAPAGTALRYRIAATYRTGPNTFSNKVSVTTTGPAATASAPPTATPATPAPAEPVPVPGMPTIAQVSPEPVVLQAAPPTTSAGRLIPLASATPIEQAPLPTRTPIAIVAPAPTPAPAVTPVNPSAFSAKQTGPGQVQLSWQPVQGASYYVLLGPGVPDGGTRVTGVTTFTATAVPVGSHEWAVASYYEPGPVSTVASAFPRVQLTVDEILSGWADLHTHPMINLAMAGKLVHGGVDIGSFLPQDLSCKGPTRATSIAQALSDDRPSHGGHDLFNFTCGDEFRNKIIIPGFQAGNKALVTPGAARGFPDFTHWPKWNDITHQKMWFEWIRRARDGGLRVMVALATNNKTLGDAVSGSGETIKTDDKSSADLQLSELRMFIGRHPDFMELALGPADIKRIVQANKIAVVLGVEIDNIGNFNLLPPGALTGFTAEAVISGEIKRLYDAGVRYILPVHVMDNAFGGTAIYENGFNTSNRREAGHFWEIECAAAADGITHTYNSGTDWFEVFKQSAGAFVKLGINPLDRPPAPPVCPPGRGHRNVRTLTANGVFAIKQMMKRGMIVDIDHMSNKAADSTLAIGKTFDYPLVSGHSGIRVAGKPHSDGENSRTREQLQKISQLHGMFGLGTAGVHAYDWAKEYQTAINVMGGSYQNGAVSFGTDLNGFVKGPVMGNEKGARLNRVVYDVASDPTSIPRSKASDSPISGAFKTWDYNTEGVAHYGLLRDFVVDIKTAPATATAGLPGSELVDNHLNRSANYFWQMWKRIESRKGSVQ